jgi:hypothetical protein
VTTERVDPAAQLRLAFEMFEFGVAMMRQKLRRAAPDASEEEIEAKLDRWLSQEAESEPPARAPEGERSLVEAP